MASLHDLGYLTAHSTRQRHLLAYDRQNGGHENKEILQREAAAGRLLA